MLLFYNFQLLLIRIWFFKTLHLKIQKLSRVKLQSMLSIPYKIPLNLPEFLGRDLWESMGTEKLKAKALGSAY